MTAERARPLAAMLLVALVCVVIVATGRAGAGTRAPRIAGPHPSQDAATQPV